MNIIIWAEIVYNSTFITRKSHFSVHVTVHLDLFLIVVPTRCTNFSKFLFWNETLYVSDSSSVHHQDFSTVHTASLYVIYNCCVYSGKLLMMDRETVRNM